MDPTRTQEEFKREERDERSSLREPARLSERYLKQLFEGGKKVSYARGQVILQHGDAFSSVGRILDGEVLVEFRNLEESTLTASDEGANP
jgi:CRP-like cAMP-binding protein